MNCKLKLLLKKFEGVTWARGPRTFLKILHTYVCKNFPGKVADKYMENLKQVLEKFKPSNGSQNLLVKSFAV